MISLFKCQKMMIQYMYAGKGRSLISERKVILYKSAVSHNVVLLHVLYLPIFVNIIMIIQLEHTIIAFSRSLQKCLGMLINPILH